MLKPLTVNDIFLKWRNPKDHSEIVMQSVSDLMEVGVPVDENDGDDFELVDEGYVYDKNDQIIHAEI